MTILAEISQAMILVLGMAAIYLLADKRGRVRRWGYVMGLLSEPFWIYSAATSTPLQWAVIGLAVWWGIFYARGMINNWSIE